MSHFPTYAELLKRADGPPGSAWGVFGADDELGTLNHLTPDIVREATSLVKDGEVLNLDLPLDVFRESLIPTRKPLRHALFASNPFHRDEVLDSFYTQSATQLDGLRHIGHPEFGFYNGADPERFTAGEPLLGINRYAEHGIVGRGVLLDVDRHLRGQGVLPAHRQIASLWSASQPEISGRATLAAWRPATKPMCPDFRRSSAASVEPTSFVSGVEDAAGVIVSASA